MGVGSIQSAGGFDAALTVDFTGNEGERGLPDSDKLQSADDTTGSIRILLTNGSEGTSKSGVEMTCEKVGDIQNGRYVLADRYSDMELDLNQLNRQPGRSQKQPAILLYPKNRSHQMSTQIYIRERQTVRESFILEIFRKVSISFRHLPVNIMMRSLPFLFLFRTGAKKQEKCFMILKLFPNIHQNSSRRQRERKRRRQELTVRQHASWGVQVLSL